MEVTKIPGIGEATAKKLAKANIRTVQDLASADADTVSSAAGVPKKKVGEWQKKAGKLLGGGAAADAIAGATASVAAAIADMRVVLREKAHTARVRVGERVVEGLPIVTAKLHENERRILERVRQDAVLLKEKAETALVKIDGKVHENVPLFKEKLVEAREGAESVVKEIRVRVQEIREKRRAPPEPLAPEAAPGASETGGEEPKKKGFLAKLLKR